MGNCEVYLECKRKLEMRLEIVLIPSSTIEGDGPVSTTGGGCQLLGEVDCRFPWRGMLTIEKLQMIDNERRQMCFAFYCSPFKGLD